MGCLVALFALISPRLTLVLIAIFSNLLSRAFDSVLLPLIGFFVLPWTTLAYAVMWHYGHAVHGFDWFVVAVAFLADIGALDGSRRARDARA